MTIDILIADDHSLFRASLRKIVESQPDMRVVGEAANGIEALELVDHHHPQVVLMDVRMPEMDGIDATHLICATHHDIRVIALSSYAETFFTQKMIEAGACRYLAKSSDRKNLLACIREVGSIPPGNHT